MREYKRRDPTRKKIEALGTPNDDQNGRSDQEDIAIFMDGTTLS